MDIENSLRKMIGRKIYRARVEAGLEQKELAQKLKYTQSSVSRWENDKMSCPAEILFMIADLTGKPIQWFYELSDSKTEEEDIPQKIGINDLYLLIKEMKLTIDSLEKKIDKKYN